VWQCGFDPIARQFITNPKKQHRIHASPDVPSMPPGGFWKISKNPKTVAHESRIGIPIIQNTTKMIPININKHNSSPNLVLLTQIKNARVHLHHN